MFTFFLYALCGQHKCPARTSATPFLLRLLDGIARNVGIRKGILNLANKYYGGKSLSENGGIKQIASDLDLNVGQVRSILKEFDVLYGDWSAKQS